MRLVVIVLSLAVSSLAIPAVKFAEPSRFYHDTVGFELAARIKADETARFAKRGSNPVDANGDFEDPRIVGGAVAPSNSHPYLAGLLIMFVSGAGPSVCGASLLSTNRLVTAAHCWFDGFNQARQFEVVLGSHFLFFDGMRIATSNVIMHPQWTTWNLANDVAMILLPTNVLLNQNIQLIALPPANSLWDTFNGRWTVAAGWGKTNDVQQGVSTSTQVSHVNLQVMSVLQCQQVFGPTYVQQSTLCTFGTGGVGVCGGDSGGPLLLNNNGQNILVGISSFVDANGCQNGNPSAFARVTSFYSFITQYL